MRLIKGISFAKIICTVFLLSLTEYSLAITAQGKHFINEQGAKIIFRGYGIQTKAPPFQPIQSAAELDVLADMGANLIRFNFIWEAAEPEEGVYDESYFEYYHQVVNWAWERGIYVLVDFHNNAYSRYAANGCGSGFPAWAVSPAVGVVEPKPNGDCKFAPAMMQAMLSRENYTIWQDFMTDKYGARTRFFELTQRLAATYANHPAVIGFDFNEPMVFKPGLTFDSELVNQFFLDWHQSIQSISSKYFTFLGDNPLQFILINKPPLLLIPQQGLAALDAHFYEAGASALGFPLLDPTPNLNALVATRDKYNIPLLVGEYGANMTRPNNQAFQYQMDIVQRRFDKELLSSARWNYTPHWNPTTKDHFHDEDYSCFDENKSVRLTCYPRANVQVLSGDLVRLNIHHTGEAKFFVPVLPFLSNWFKYNDTLIDLKWNHVPSQGATKIFASKAVIFAEKPVTIDTHHTDLTCEWDSSECYLLCSAPTAGEKWVTISGN